MNKRRKLVIALGAAAFAPVAALAQSKQQPVLIAWLNSGTRKDSEHLLAAFKEGLAAFGWKEGSGYVMEERWADARSDRLPALAGELAAKNPALFLAAPTTAAAAAAKAAPGTPVVHATGGDMVGTGLVASLARPGGMITGITNLSTRISEKYLEYLLDAVPTTRRVGILIDSGAVTGALHREAVERSIAQHRVEARFVEAARPAEIEPSIARLSKEGAQALIVTPSTLFLAERRSIIKLALAYRWPIIGSNRPFADEGALLSYGIDISANYRRAAWYVDRILKGAKPAEIPVEQPTKFELVVNMKTAEALGISIPNSMLVRADKLIK